MMKVAAGSKILLYKDKLTGHKESIVGVYSPQGDKGGILVSVSRDGRLKVWNLLERDFILKRILQKNKNSIEDIGQKQEVLTSGIMDSIESCLFNDKTVICGYMDGIINAWNMKEGALVYRFEGHDDKISGLLWITADRILSSSFDSTLIFWDTLTGTSSMIVKMEHEINMMSRLKNKIYLLCNSRDVLAFDLDSNTVDCKIELLDHSVTCIFVNANFILFGDTMNHLYMIKHTDILKDDVRKTGGILKKTRILGHEGWILGIQEFDKYILTLCDDKVIRVYNGTTMTIQDELYGHKNGVVCATVANSYIYTGGFDQTIRSWSLDDLEGRIRIREKIKQEEAYSMKAEAYHQYMDLKKKKKKKKRATSSASIKKKKK